MSVNARRWYVIQCKPREDDRAAQHLGNQGFEIWRPQLQREAVKQGRRVVVSEPLFPGYVFIRLSEVEDNWAPIRSTRGVARLVRFGLVPAVVPDAVMDDIASRLALVDAPPEALFAPGQKVRIETGPFAGLEAVFAAHDGTERVIVLLKLLQQMQTLSLPVESLSPLPEGSSPDA